MRTRVVLLSGLAIVLALGSASSAGRFNKVLSIGDVAPSWKDLPGIDGKRHSLADLKDAKAIVLVFTSNACPVAAAYEERLIRFTKSYRDKGVAVVAINVSDLGEGALEKMKRHARERGFNFPYLHDPSQEAGRKYGASCTPSLFLLDAGRKVAYMGAFDDHNDPSAVTKEYLRNAVDAVLSGKPPVTTESRPRGCLIEYESKQ
jgi:peroxiredoxin